MTERRLEGDKLDRLLARFQSEYEKNGLKKRLVSLKTRLGDPRACKLGLSMAIRMLASDGKLQTSEREFILEMADSLGVDRDTAADLVKEIAG